MAMELNYKLPQVLSKLLKEKGKTQRWLAEQTGTTETTISRYVSGNRKPKIDIAFKIAKILNIGIDELISGIDDDE